MMEYDDDVPLHDSSDNLTDSEHNDDLSISKFNLEEVDNSTSPSTCDNEFPANHSSAEDEEDIRSKEIQPYEDLDKSIEDEIYNLNLYNIKKIANGLLQKNILVGSFCLYIRQAQSISPDQTHLYAALMSIINAEIPHISEILLLMLMREIKKAVHQNDKTKGLINLCFLAHLINQRVAHDTLGIDVLEALVESPSEISIALAIEFLKDCGNKLMEVNAIGVDDVFIKLKIIQKQPQLSLKVKSMIDSMLLMTAKDFDLNPVQSLKLDFIKGDNHNVHTLTSKRYKDIII